MLNYQRVYIDWDLNGNIPYCAMFEARREKAWYDLGWEWLDKQNGTADFKRLPNFPIQHSDS
jgi:hypothetical protein